MGALPWPAWNDLTPYRVSSGLLAPADEPGQKAAGPPGRLPGLLCPNCIVDVDADGFCSMCGRTVKP